MAQNPVYLTPEGHAELEQELEHLVSTRRKEVADNINDSKELGTSVNNAGYDDAKREQSFIEGRIRELESILKIAKVVDAASKGWVQVGSKVILTTDDGKEETFHIVGSAEAHPLENKISNESPVGKALMGKKVGNPVKVMTPGGVITYTIKTID